jgi:hypothetical protein
MRKYQAIWEQLKATGKCTVASPVAYHRRVIKAVLKERTQDTLYKFMLSEKKWFVRVYFKRESSKITFSLKVYKSVEEKLGIDTGINFMEMGADVKSN